ncbi:TrkA family potassium uptake protein [Tepidibacillus infernus]|uniref:Potassium uptake system protein n=1 Tax=Tepidibacillus decaturensis TaxID=1413211 RepID=A0A135L1X8_9BACI|nr:MULTISPECIES: TrkA family potassium uptake protein [Tepidibacillus]KXG42907.1 potassium uptake system protein [Tepidibacillus decaturensis]GBF12433.1 ktr system potassium uptake protein A [Tepidibacillus sp. HK-1]
MSKQFAVIGLGRFGSSVAKELYDLHYEVMAIDINEERIQENVNVVTHCVQADSTDETALKALGIRNFDVVVVAIGQNIQASILTTILLKELGVETIVVKAQNQLHAKVLYKIGASKVVFPERDMGARVAHNLVTPNILDYIELSDEYSIVEIIASEKMNHKSLVELNIRARFGCNVMAIKNDHRINVAPDANDMIKTGDILVVIGHNKDLRKFEDFVMNGK